MGTVKRALKYFVIVSVVLGILLIPAPRATRSDGIVWLADSAKVVAPNEAIVAELLVSNNSKVNKNQPLLRLQAPLLNERIAVNEAYLDEQQARYDALRIRQPAQAIAVKDGIDALARSIEEDKAHREKLIVRSPSDGTVVIPAFSDLIGRYTRKGALLAYVVTPSAISVRVAVSPEQLDSVTSAESVELRYAENVFRTVRAKGISAITQSDPFYILQLSVPPESIPNAIGASVYVRFNHGFEALGMQLITAMDQQLTRFNL